MDDAKKTPTDKDVFLRKSELLEFYQNWFYPRSIGSPWEQVGFDQWFMMVDIWKRGVIPVSVLLRFLRRLGVVLTEKDI